MTITITSRWLRRLAISIPIGIVVGALLAFVFQPKWTDWSTLGDRSLLADGVTTSYTGSQTTITDSIRMFDHSVWIDASETGLVVDRTDLMCHGGYASISWRLGNLEPVTTDTGIHLTMRLDEQPIASVLRGTSVDTWGDHPLTIATAAHCPAGPHRLDIKVDSIEGGWGFPYVVGEDSPPSSSLRVVRGFVVIEAWNGSMPSDLSP